MAPTTPTGEPSEIVAGDSIRWRVADHTDYPQFEGWTLKYELVDVNTQSITAVWQTSGDDNGKLTRKIFVLSAWIGLKDQMRAVIRYLIPELWRRPM